ncbi:hypothetical protein ACOME3_009902 [Neoechinorhynchus agilis]
MEGEDTLESLNRAVVLYSDECNAKSNKKRDLRRNRHLRIKRVPTGHIHSDWQSLQDITTMVNTERNTRALSFIGICRDDTSRISQETSCELENADQKDDEDVEKVV